MSEQHLPSDISSLVGAARVATLTEPDPYTRFGMCMELIQEDQADFCALAVGALHEVPPLTTFPLAPYVQKEVSAYTLLDVLAAARNFEQAEQCLKMLKTFRRETPVMIGISRVLRKGYAGERNQYAALPVQDIIDTHAESAGLGNAVAAYAAGLAGYGLNVLEPGSYAANVFDTSVALLPLPDRQEHHRSVATAYVESGFLALAQDMAEQMTDPSQRGRVYAAIANQAHVNGDVALATDSIRRAIEKITEITGPSKTLPAGALAIGADVALVLAKYGDPDEARKCMVDLSDKRGDYNMGLPRAKAWAELYNASGIWSDRKAALAAFASTDRRVVSAQEAGDFFGKIGEADRRSGNTIEIPDDASVVPIMCLEMAGYAQERFRDVGFIALIKEVAVTAPVAAWHMLQRIEAPKYRVRAMASLGRSALPGPTA